MFFDAYSLTASLSNLMYAFMPVNWDYRTYDGVVFLTGDLTVEFRRRALGDSLLPSRAGMNWQAVKWHSG